MCSPASSIALRSATNTRGGFRRRLRRLRAGPAAARPLSTRSVNRLTHTDRRRRSRRTRLRRRPALSSSGGRCATRCSGSKRSTARRHARSSMCGSRKRPCRRCLDRSQRRNRARSARARSNPAAGHSGVRRQGRLVTMAGEWLRAGGYMGIGAVCVDAAFRGSGARGRTDSGADRDGPGARRNAACTCSHRSTPRSTYRALGFVLRRDMHLLVPGARMPAQTGCTAHRDGHAAATRCSWRQQRRKQPGKRRKNARERDQICGPAADDRVAGPRSVLRVRATRQSNRSSCRAA